MTKKISILGSTGSIGTNTLNVVRNHPEAFGVVALAAGANVDLLIRQAMEFQPKLVSVGSEQAAEHLRAELPESIEVVHGEEGLIAAAVLEEAEFVVTAVVGSRGLRPTIEAIKCGKTIGLANKETLVSAGHLVMELAEKHGVTIIPIDSEHSAIYQCLNGERISEVRQIILTASGGSFRHKTRDELKEATVEDALKHPNWSMGAKITIDSATMMNKGFEVIEAHWLFGIPYDRIQVLIHPESTIHSMVEFVDGAIMAQLGTPDMKVPIQYALAYPQRLPMDTDRLSLAKLQKLHFSEPDFDRFPALKYAFDSGRIGGTMPTVLNAANEIAVERFLNKEIPFLAIEECAAKAMDAHDVIPTPGLEEILEADRWARAFVRSLSF